MVDAGRKSALLRSGRALRSERQPVWQPRGRPGDRRSIRVLVRERPAQLPIGERADERAGLSEVETNGSVAPDRHGIVEREPERTVVRIHAQELALPAAERPTTFVEEERDHVRQILPARLPGATRLDLPSLPLRRSTVDGALSETAVRCDRRVTALRDDGGADGRARAVSEGEHLCLRVELDGGERGPELLSVVEDHPGP